MTYCSECGTATPAGGRFCPGCGRAIEGAPAAPPPVPAAPPPAPAAGAARPGAPAWLAADWLVAVVAAGLLLGVCVAVALPYGALLGVAGTGEAGALVSGLVTGVVIPFAMFGIEAAAARADGGTLVVFGARYLPLLLMVVPAAATWLAMRFAVPRVRRDPAFLVAIVVKIAVVVCVTAAVMAALVSIGDEGDLGNDGFVAAVSVGAAAIYPLLLVVPVGLAWLWRHGIRPGADRVRRITAGPWVRHGVWGAAAFAVLAAAMGVLVLLADLVTADDGRGRLLELVRIPLDQGNEGVAGAVVAMGGAVARLGSHTSLLHWGAYDRPGTGNAPAPLFLLPALAPAAVAWVTWRRLEAGRRTTDHEVLRVATAVTAGFVLTAWLFSFLGRIDRATPDPLVQPSPRGAFGLGLLWAPEVLRVATAVTAGFVLTAWLFSFLGRIDRATPDPLVQPSPRGAFGLGLLWAAVGAAAATAVWSRRHGVRWTALRPLADGGPEAAGAGPATVVGTGTAPMPAVLDAPPPPPPAAEPVPYPTLQDPAPPAAGGGPTTPDTGATVELDGPAAGGAEPDPPTAGTPVTARTCPACGAPVPARRGTCPACAAAVPGRTRRSPPPD